ncbi:unnamed protein product [Discosporangium mesarthrocarpum]
MPGVPVTVQQFFRCKLSRKVVHFIGKGDMDRVHLPEGSTVPSDAQDAGEYGGSLGISIELPLKATRREVMETLWMHLERVEDPLRLRIMPMPAGKPQLCPVRMMMQDLDSPQHTLHRLLDVNGNNQHTSSPPWNSLLVFEVLPIGLDTMDGSRAVVEAYCLDTVLKEHWKVGGEKPTRAR